MACLIQAAEERASKLIEEAQNGIPDVGGPAPAEAPQDVQELEAAAAEVVRAAAEREEVLSTQLAAKEAENKVR